MYCIISVNVSDISSNNFSYGFSFNFQLFPVSYPIPKHIYNNDYRTYYE